MRCDLHVHTWHSGMCTIPVLKRICRECYTTPEQAYQTLKRRGMQLVTVTDHDEIGASVDLARYPDFFLSEEVTVTLPSGCEAHIGVYDITEKQHMEMQARRHDMPRLLAYLQQEQLLYSINHMFSSLTGRRMAEDFELFAKHFPAFEVLNGAMPRRGNHAAQEAQRRLNRIGLAGSDSHGHLSLGRAWTQVPGARGKDEFFAGLRAQRSTVGGNNGSYFRLSGELLTIAGSLFQDKPWTLGLAPLIALIPVASLINYGFEVASEGHWRKRWLEALRGTPKAGYESNCGEVAA
jgi:predicted metal-dependent phosphoesterase TrpH